MTSADFVHTKGLGSTSTVAIYSRSQLGYGDLGVNGDRIERWLEKLKQVVPVSK